MRAVAKALVLLAVAGCWSVPAQRAADLWSLPEAVVQNLSGERARTHVVELSRFYREDATPGFHEAAQYVAAQARAVGLDDVRIETFPVDGRIRHFNMQSRYAWAPRRAELWLVDPAEKLADFAEASTHLATWSAPADVETELVDVGGGTRASDYEGKEVRGKIVFTSSTPSAVQAEAVGRRGAAGIVSMWSPPSRAGFPDQVHWLDTANNRREPKTFAFVLSLRQGLALRSRLARGTVRVRATVDADLGAGNLEVVTATLPGRELAEESVVLVAHICHFSPSSNDDASGCGLLLEIARAWREAIRRGALAAPRRTIRFLWVPENYGTVAYAAAHPEISGRVRAALSLDMVGEDLDRCNSVFRLIRTPDSRPSFLNDVVEHFARLVAGLEIAAPSGTRARFRYEVDDYTGGSDHVWFNDAGVGVPAMLLTHWPDNFYHSSEDTPDKVDPSELRRVGLVAFGAARYVASVSGSEVRRLAARVALGGRRRITFEMDRALTYAAGAERAALARVTLGAALEREERAVLSSAALDPAEGAAVRALAEAFRMEEQATIARLAALLPEAPEDTSFPEGALVPRRTGRYLSSMWRNNLADKLPAAAAERAFQILERLPQGAFSAFEFFNLIDGKRRLDEIARVLESERNAEYLFDEYFGNGSMAPPPPYRGPRCNRAELTELVRLAEKAGLVAIPADSRR